MPGRCLKKGEHHDGDDGSGGLCGIVMVGTGEEGGDEGVVVGVTFVMLASVVSAAASRTSTCY